MYYFNNVKVYLYTIDKVNFIDGQVDADLTTFLFCFEGFYTPWTDYFFDTDFDRLLKLVNDTPVSFRTSVN